MWVMTRQMTRIQVYKGNHLHFAKKEIVSNDQCFAKKEIVSNVQCSKMEGLHCMTSGLGAGFTFSPYLK